MCQVIETLLSKPYWLIDVLPKQVPAGQGGQYFRIERFLTESPRVDDIFRRFGELLVKLNCYYSMQVSFDGEEWTKDPAPEEIFDTMRERIQMFILVGGDALVTFSGEDHYMTLYNPSEELVALVGQLATSVGLFVWKHSAS